MEEDAYSADATCAALLAVAIGEGKFEGMSHSFGADERT